MSLKIFLYLNKLKKIVKRKRRSVSNKVTEYMAYRQFGKRTILNLEDLLGLQKNAKGFKRLDFVVRYLAILEYHGKGNGTINGIELYCKMQERRSGKKNLRFAERRLIKLINSYEQKGYDQKEAIILDKNLQLIDGSHRLAMAIYYNIRDVNVVIVNRAYYVEDYSVHWFYQNGFTNEEIDLIESTASRIRTIHETVFTGIIWASAMHVKEDILKDLGRFGCIRKAEEFCYAKEMQYEAIVKKLYAIDDIKEWKIVSKYEHMREKGRKLCAFHLEISDPEYRKKQTGMPISISIEKIKRNIRQRYKDKISDYYYDVIVHIADNTTQSRYMDMVLWPELPMGEFLNILRKHECAIIKYETPYFPLDFPNSIPIGRDVDILCIKEDFEELFIELLKAAQRVKNSELYVRSAYRGSNNWQIRFEASGKLLLLFDISCMLPHLSEEFTYAAIKTRQKHRDYYVLDYRYEYLVRMCAYVNDKRKEYHLEYMKHYRDKFDPSIAYRYMKKKMIRDIERKIAE